ncbi:MAG: helix-turn-helix domain-containing protein [Mycobacteriales bacterium]
MERLEGSQRAKQRLQVILETLAGTRSIIDACEILGICESMFHRLRAEVLQTALDRLEPRPLGRPRCGITAEAQQAEALEQEVEELRTELQASQVREELAQIMPSIVRPSLKKTPHLPTLTDLPSRMTRGQHRNQSSDEERLDISISSNEVGKP